MSLLEPRHAQEYGTHPDHSGRPAPPAAHRTNSRPIRMGRSLPQPSAVRALGASLLHYAGDAVEAVLGPVYGSQLFSRLVRSLPGYGPADDEQGIERLLEQGDWRAVVNQHLFAFDIQEIFGTFAQLYAFARGGEGAGQTPDNCASKSRPCSRNTGH